MRMKRAFASRASAARSRSLALSVTSMDGTSVMAGESRAGAEGFAAGRATPR